MEELQIIPPRYGSLAGCYRLVGGYPFEVASPGEVIKFFRARGFCEKNVTTCGKGYGCNEFVLKKREKYVWNMRDN